MKIGIQTRLWGAEMNRSRMVQLLEQAAAAGYEGVEIGAQHLDLDHPAELHRLLHAYDLQVVSLHVAGMYDQPAVARLALEQAERAVDAAAALGADFVTVSGREDAEKTPAEIEAYAARLSELGELCHACGLRLCHHNHYWEIAHDCRELKALCAQTDPQRVWLCLDLGWCQRLGGDAVAITRSFLERVGYVHLRDVAGGDWAPLGRGEVDYPALLKLLDSRPIEWQVVELEPPDPAGPAAGSTALALAMACAERETVRMYNEGR